MIIFEKIKFKNFLSYGNNYTTLFLNRKSNTLIVGKNGSGKSSIITDTLTFALYGKPYRKINKSSLINSVNKKDCVVQLDFKKNNIKYTVIRGLKPNVFEIYKEGQLLNQSKNNDYQKILEEEILQLNYNSFIQTIIIGKKYIPFMQLNTTDRRNLIEELFNINYFTEMNTNVKIKSKLNKENITETKYQIENIKNLLENENKNLNILYQQNNQLIETKQNDRSDYENQIKENENRITSLEKQYQITKKEAIDVSSFDQSIHKIDIFINQLDNESKKLQKENVFYETSDVCSVCKQKIENDFKNQIISNNLIKINEQKSKLLKLIEKKEQIQQQIKEYNNINESVNKKLNQINIQFNNLINENNNFNNMIKKIDMEIKTLSNKDNLIKDKEKYILELKNNLKELENTFNQLNENQQYYDIILDILKDDGLKTYLIKIFLPLINETMSKYMDIFNFNCSFTLDEQFNEVIKSRFRDEFTYFNFSEGEKLRIDLALLFVFREIAKTRNSVNTNILIMDEVLDNSLDEDGINGFLTILKTIESDKDVFVISHHSEKYYNLFPNIIEIEKKINYSEVKVDTFAGI